MLSVHAQFHAWGQAAEHPIALAGDAFCSGGAIRLMDEGGVDPALIRPPGWDRNSTALTLQVV
jgi:hypothetical protein